MTTKSAHIAACFRFVTLPCKPIFGGQDSHDPNYNLTNYDPMRPSLQDCNLQFTLHVSTGRDSRASLKEGGAVIDYVSHSLSPTIEPDRRCDARQLRK